MVNKKILVIVPAYNESESIVDVINSIVVSQLDCDIIVINDGSTDNTFQLASGTQQAIAIDLPTNIGIGGAVQTGFKYAYRNNYDIAIQFDGDGQHNANEIGKILAPILNDQANCVIGSRFLGNNDGFQSSFVRRLGINLFKHINSFLIKQKITDNTSGFRAYDKKSIKLLAGDYPMDYPEPEIVIMLGRKGYIISEVSVIMNERTGGTSSINGLKPIYYMIKVLLSIFITYMRK